MPIHEHSKGGTNIHKAVDQEFGDVAGGFAASKYVRSMTCDFPGVTHAYTEPMAAIAHYDQDGRLKMISATQVPHYLHRALAEVMEMAHDKIQVIKPLLGSIVIPCGAAVSEYVSASWSGSTART